MTLDQLPLGLGIGFAIGAALGLLGGGGSILTVPALVYLLGQSPQAAVITSLAIVGINSAVGVIFHQRSGNCRWGVALIFGGAGMLTAYLSAGISWLLPPALLMVLFAALMLVIAVLMLASDRHKHPDTAVNCAVEKPNLMKVILAGAGVGVLTGILGVGGGFLIVPALVMLIGLPMLQAVGTSLVVIAANSAAGLLGHMGMPLDLWLTAAFAAAGIAGTYAGARLGRKLPAVRLRQGFAGFILILALLLLVDNLPKLLATT